MLVLFSVGERPSASAVNDLIADLQAALAQPEKTPVAWMYKYANPRRDRGLGFYETPDFEATCIPLYTAPPQRKPLRTVIYACPICAASLERQE